MTAFRDPYDEMTDPEFAEHVQSLFERDRQVSITMHIPESLLIDLRALAATAKVPYQRLMKSMLVASVHWMSKQSTVRRCPPAAKGSRSKPKPRVKA